MKKALLIIGLTLLLVLFCSIVLYSQTSNWRTNPPQQSQPQQRVETPKVQPPTPPRNDVSNWRNQPPSNGYDRPLRTRPGSNILVRDPFFNDWGWGWNRWNMWGAPTFGWNYWNPGFYFNDWGYRQPARVYVYDNGKRDTIKGKKPVISFGIQKTGGNQIGGFFTMGNKAYFIAEYNTTFERDFSTFFQYGNITQVDFPMVSDLIEQRNFYVGIGKRIKRTGIHMMIGSVTEDVKWRGKDDIGYITFPKYKDRFTTVKVGVLHDFKNLTIKYDYDPIIRSNTFGLGMNF
jgi:hypothetical protein